MEAGGRAAVERGLEFGILGPLQVGRVLTLDAAIAEALEASV